MPHAAIQMVNVFEWFEVGDHGGQMRPVCLTTFVALVCMVSPASAQSPSLPQPQSVFLEELTWLEVRDAVAGGKTTVIIPTGGTEQNGPHMALGKHNYLVKYKAGEVAKQLGNALVAPVVAYVPEGDIEPPTGYPGRGDDWVVSQGISSTDVGSHAGTHDTSSLMHLNPSMLRFDRMGPGKSGDGQGHAGNPAKATALFGKHILEMQVDDAVKQIQGLRVSSRR